MGEIWSVGQILKHSDLKTFKPTYRYSCKCVFQKEH